jgi:type I restriction enzyme S subunit
MSEWKEYKLGEVLTFQRGHDLPRTEMIEGIYPVAGSNGIIGFHSKHTTKGPGITIGRSGNIGTPHFYKNDFWAHNTVLYVKDFKGNYEPFLYYFLKTLDFTQFNTGSAVPSLNRNHIHELFVEIPPLPEQTAIATVLSSLDNKIDLLHRQNATLEKMAETLFRQWFVEEAKEEWEEKTLGEITEIKAGGDKPKIYSDTKTEECKVPIFSNGIDKEGLYGFTNTAKIFKECITISARGTIGFVCLRQEPFVPIVRLISIVPNKKYLSVKYLYLWAKTQDILGTGTTQEQLTVPDFSRTKIVLPPFTKMVEFTNHVDTLFRKKDFNQTQIRTLTALRDTLLPKLMSGEVKVEMEQEVQKI